MTTIDEELSEMILARQPVFLANRKADVEKLRQALALKDFACIRSIGHNCKGTGAGYGFPNVSSIGLAIENAAKAADAQAAGESIDQLEQCVLAASKNLR